LDHVHKPETSITDAPPRPVARPPAPPALRRLKTLHSRADIDAILHRECARCERNGHEFSIVFIKAADSGAHRHLARIGQLLCDRARLTDEIGWFDSDRLCIILPDTTGGGARDFARQFTNVAYMRALSPICSVLTYPSDWRQPTAGPDGSESMIIGLPSEAAALGQHLPPVEGISQLLIRPIPFWKRVTDICIAIAALIMLSPLMGLAALAIRLSDHGPIFFKQQRAGLGGRPFTIFKFRTMVVDAEKKKAALRRFSEQDGPAFKIKHDPRITRIGRILRETSLDELPQLWNVLIGDMSLVGPRPLPIDESNSCDIWHRRRLDVTPGLTCIWQVMGRSTVSFADWVRMDRTYIGRQSLWQDIKLIVMTVPSVLMRRGAK
jgi:lipopolysaccharide/colanic/teichoic acid biosynthesis glycosyltransferase